MRRWLDRSRQPRIRGVTSIGGDHDWLSDLCRTVADHSGGPVTVRVAPLVHGIDIVDEAHGLDLSKLD